MHVGIRPSDVLVQQTPGDDVARAEVLVTEPSERTVVGTLRVDGVDFKVRAPAEAGLREGSPTYVRFASASLMLFDATTGNALG